MVEFRKIYSLRRLGLAVAAIWLVVLIAALGAVIFREVDGSTVRSVSSENVALATVNSELSEALNETRKDLAKVANALISKQSENEQLLVQISEVNLREAQANKTLSQFIRWWPLDSAADVIK